ncbi:MAG: hypothetical protein COB67_02555 [SAR324 cluster bacterium]|uniref:Uncharacterized protein n=1 Tax=SAR324 cluster bacterium TaxID=2024889 RepID=A0A2A4T973_9DELT|nr:MAG: hypothetical protein COB67_02555 [SAR324 cluster bacterium]
MLIDLMFILLLAPIPLMKLYKKISSFQMWILYGIITGLYQFVHIDTPVMYSTVHLVFVFIGSIVLGNLAVWLIKRRQKKTNE